MTSRILKEDAYDLCDWRCWVGDPNIWVSNTGLVVSYKRGFLYELTQSLTYNGYLQCNIGRQRDTLIHRIVAKTWVSNSDRTVQIEVNHRDGDKWNNNAINLEWVTSLQNIQHSIETGLKGVSPQSIPIRIVETGEVFPSIASCAKSIKGSDRNIGMCLLGRRYTHKGYSFEYVKGKAA